VSEGVFKMIDSFEILITFRPDRLILKFDSGRRKCIIMDDFVDGLHKVKIELSIILLLHVFPD
jgi:hypothetical protein